MFNNRNTTGTNNPMSKLSAEDIAKLVAMKGTESTKSAAALMGVSVRTVQNYWRYSEISKNAERDPSPPRLEVPPTHTIPRKDVGRSSPPPV